MTEVAVQNKCQHKESDNDKSIWVTPDINERMHSPAQKRPYCVHCGKIKYLGSARAKKMGYFINLLKEIQGKIGVLHKRKIMRQKLTAVQIRLIIKELEADEFFTDTFANHRFCQWDFFKDIVRKYSDIPSELLDSIHEDFKG